MSNAYPPGTNPYRSPVGLSAAPLKATSGPWPQKMEYMRAYNFIFDNPNWLSNVALLAVVGLGMCIPGVNLVIQLFVLGYQFEVIDRLIATQGRQYVDFDFGRFADYLARGVWPFLVNLVVSFVLVP